MKTDVFPVSCQGQELTSLLDKVEYISLYAGMTRTDASKMRLLGEELLTAAQNILLAYDGKLWMETTPDEFTVHLGIGSTSTAESRKKLLALSSSGKSTPPKGFFRRISAAIERVMLSDSSAAVVPVFMEYGMCACDPSLCGMVNTYHYVAPKSPEKSDELAGIEKSIIDAIVDDVLVTIHGESAEIICVKKLTKEN